LTQIGAFKIGVSHQTGNSTGLGLALVSGDLGRFTLIISILLCFILGAFVSAVIVGDNKLRLSNLYTVCLLIQSLAVFLAYGFLDSETYTGEIFLSFACGMQNALCSAYTGPVLRTTHITGNVTEIGVILGNYIHHKLEPSESGKAELWKLILLIPATLGFIGGGFIGVVVFNELQEKALLVSAASSCCAAVIGMIYLELQGRGFRYHCFPTTRKENAVGHTSKGTDIAVLLPNIYKTDWILIY
jgi:uncharacterized membrane protein YoaK (UPF0700 family)